MFSFTGGTVVFCKPVLFWGMCRSNTFAVSLHHDRLFLKQVFACWKYSFQLIIQSLLLHRILGTSVFLYQEMSHHLQRYQNTASRHCIESSPTIILGTCSLWVWANDWCWSVQYLLHPRRYKKQSNIITLLFQIVIGKLSKVLGQLKQCLGLLLVVRVVWITISLQAPVFLLVNL